MHNILQRSNIKVTGYLSDVFSKTGQSLFQLFINGEVLTLEYCLHPRVKASAEDILQAMEGKISLTDRRLLEDSLDEYRFYTHKIAQLENTLVDYITIHFLKEYELLITIPGVKQHSAAVILAETGLNIEALKTVCHLSSWAGMSPGSYESAEKKKSSRTTRGNKYLKTALTNSGGVAGRTRDPAFSSFYYSIPNKGPKMKAVMACGHKRLRVIYKELSNKLPYDEKRALGLRQQSNQKHF